jgi:hypothetical protein
LARENGYIRVMLLMYFYFSSCDFSQHNLNCFLQDSYIIQEQSLLLQFLKDADVEISEITTLVTDALRDCAMEQIELQKQAEEK